MNKTLLLSLALFGIVISTDIELHASDGRVVSTDEVSNLQSSTFERNIANVVEERFQQTISHINDRLKKEQGKLFWATLDEWSSSINALKELIVIAKDINSTTDEERNTKYDKTANLFINNIWQNLRENSENALKNVGNAITTWMCYLGLYKRFHDENYQKNISHTDLTEKLFQSVISDIKEKMSEYSLSVNGNNDVNAWQLSCEKFSGEEAFTNCLKDDWYCYLTQLNVISFGYDRSVTKEVDQYEDWVNVLLRKCAERIICKDIDYLYATNTSLEYGPQTIQQLKETKDPFKKDSFLFANGYTASSNSCALILKKFGECDSDFKQFFLKFNSVQAKKSLRIFTKDVYNFEYLRLVLQYLGFCTQTEKLTRASFNTVLDQYMSKISATKLVNPQDFDIYSLKDLVEKCFELNEDIVKGDVVFETIDLLIKLIDLSGKYKINMPFYVAIKFAPVLQRCSVDPENFLKKISPEKWNASEGVIGFETDLGIQALLELLYNRTFNDNEKNLLHVKYSNWFRTREICCEDQFTSFIKFAIDCQKFGIDFLKALPILGSTYHSIKYDSSSWGWRRIIPESDFIRFARRCTLYAVSPTKVNKLFADFSIENKALLDSCLRECKIWAPDWWNIRYPDLPKGYFDAQKFYPEKIVEPGMKIKEQYKLNNSSK